MLTKLQMRRAFCSANDYSVFLERMKMIL